jgi:anti-sigma regulatory factor (Ser/Thr protein kinase)
VGSASGSPSSGRIAGVDVDAGTVDRIARRYALTVVELDQAPDLVVLNRAQPGSITRCFASGAGAVVELDGDERLPASALVPVSGQGHLFLSLTTGSAYLVEAANHVVQALIQRGAIANSNRHSLELAAHEAVTNAIVHGNLGIESGPSDDPASFSRFFAEVQTRLSQPAIARRRVAITASWDGRGIELSVADEGKGYDTGGFVSTRVNAKSGRGLNIMRELATALDVSDGGRCLTLRFGR